MASGLNRPAGQLEADPLAPYGKPLDQRTAAHLLRRAGFGGSSDEVKKFATMSSTFAAETLIHYPDTSSLPPPDNIFNPREELIAINLQFRGMSQDMDKRAQQQDVRKQMRASVISMQLWWLNRMLTTPAPLQEKMALFFHGHFTSAAIEKGVWPTFVWNQNELYRRNALGNLHDLTLAVSQDPAMLRYLDNASSNKTHPNENYARELMELFTLGHGNYTEEDIRQSARAFTGWAIDGKTGEFFINQRNHDTGSKTFLGQTGDFDGEDIVNIIYQQPACARYWAHTLLEAFVYSDPEPELVDAVADVLHRNNYTLAPVMSKILQSRVFYSERAYRALVKSPVEFVVGTYNALGLQEVDPSSLRALNQMGQVLFYPPNVAGWPGGANWITSQTLIARENFVAQLVNAPMMDSSWLQTAPMDPQAASQLLVAQILQGDAPDQALAQLFGYLNGEGTSALKNLSVENFQERVRGAAYLAMAMPAYQLS